ESEHGRRREQLQWHGHSEYRSAFRGSRGYAFEQQYGGCYRAGKRYGAGREDQLELLRADATGDSQLECGNFGNFWRDYKDGSLDRDTQKLKKTVNAVGRARQ